MRARILKIGFRYQPEIYDERDGWVACSKTDGNWRYTIFPKRFWLKRNAIRLLESFEEFDV